MQPSEQQPPQPADPFVPDITFWRQRIARLPEVRTHKVNDARKAIETNRYEAETIIDETVRRVAEQLGL